MALVYTDVTKTVEEGLARVSPTLQPDVVRIRFGLGENWLGEDALYFRVILQDSAADRKNLTRVANHVRDTLLREIEPRKLGMDAYVHFRSESEQAAMKDKSWE